MDEQSNLFRYMIERFLKSAPQMTSIIIEFERGNPWLVMSKLQTKIVIAHADDRVQYELLTWELDYDGSGFNLKGRSLANQSTDCKAFDGGYCYELVESVEIKRIGN